VPQFGFCYVADCNPYIDEALVSIASLRAHMPDAPVAMITRRELFRTDDVVTDWVELGQSRKGPIVKADAWLAPYERVIFLDSDTLIIGDLTGVFPLLDKFDFASVAEPNARPDRGMASGVPAAFPEVNTGFFAFRKTSAVQRLFQSWIEEFDRLHELSGVTANQPALRIALWKSQVRPLTLGSEYNLILHANCGVSGVVRVVHDRSPDREATGALVNRHLSPRAVIPGFGPVFGFITRRGWVRQYVRLSWRFVRVLLRPNLVRQQGHPVIWWRDGID
jgi:hypothetical protein